MAEPEYEVEPSLDVVPETEKSSNGLFSVDVANDDIDGNDNIDENDDHTDTIMDSDSEVIYSDVDNLIVDETYDDNDDEDTDDEDYLQKFDSELRQNYIAETHPETAIHNYDEVNILTNVIRNENNVIVDELHRTVPCLTKYERTRIIGARAKQLNEGCRPLVKVKEHVIDGYLIAQQELEEKKIPFIIKRPIPGGGSEYWKLADLEII